MASQEVLSLKLTTISSPVEENHEVLSLTPLDRSFRRCLFGKSNQQGDMPYLPSHDSDVMISPSLSRSVDFDFPIRRTKSDNVISPRIRKSDDDSFLINKRIMIETERPRTSPGDTSPSHDDFAPFESISFKIKREKVFLSSPSSPASSQLPPLPNRTLEYGDSHKHNLPFQKAPNGCNQITPETVAKLIDGLYCETVPVFQIIDCRFEYEYSGGHIKSAINVPSTTELEDMYLLAPPKQKVVLIFHCEFSSHRGPNLYKHLRRKDRELHLHTYPELYYPEMYVIEGGYKKFWESFSNLCDPICYVPMNDPQFKKECKESITLHKQKNGTTKVKRSWSTGSIRKSLPHIRVRKDQSLQSFSLPSLNLLSSESNPPSPLPVAVDLANMRIQDETENGPMFRFL